MDAARVPHACTSWEETKRTLHVVLAMKSARRPHEPAQRSSPTTTSLPITSLAPRLRAEGAMCVTWFLIHSFQVAPTSQANTPCSNPGWSDRVRLNPCLPRPFHIRAVKHLSYGFKWDSWEQIRTATACTHPSAIAHVRVRLNHKRRQCRHPAVHVSSSSPAGARYTAGRHANSIPVSQRPIPPLATKPRRAAARRLCSPFASDHSYSGAQGDREAQTPEQSKGSRASAMSTL